MAFAGFQPSTENTVREYCELISSLYDALRWFIEDLFADTQSCRLLMSVALLKLDTGILVLFYFKIFEDTVA